MADDLISRQALLAAFRAYMVEHFDKDKCADAENCEVCEKRCLWQKVIASVPAVDAVEVVRCKDCKYSMLWRKPTAKAVGECWIRKMNSEDEQFALVDAEDFCSLGKRREANV